MILLAGLIDGREDRVTVKRANGVPSLRAWRSCRKIFGSSFTGSIRTLKAPAQVKPISKASSSPSSARNSRGSPVRVTSSAASITCALLKPPIVTAPLRFFAADDQHLRAFFPGRSSLRGDHRGQASLRRIFARRYDIIPKLLHGRKENILSKLALIEASVARLTQVLMPGN